MSLSKIKVSKFKKLLKEEIRKALKDINEGTIEEQGLDSKSIKAFKIPALSKILTKIGFPASKIEVFDDINAGPTLSVEFKNPLADENTFIDAWTDFQFDSGTLGEWLPDVQSGYHKGGNKWYFQMQK